MRAYQLSMANENKLSVLLPGARLICEESVSSRKMKFRIG